MQTAVQRSCNQSASGEARLTEVGFTADQIMQLIELRSLYPLLEFVDSWATVNRLRFLKWQVSMGQIEI
jgi:hypothetical protein